MEESKAIQITKTMERSHAYKGYVRFIMLNFGFFFFLQFCDKKLLAKLTGFKFVTTIALKLRKTENDDEKVYNTFY